MLEQKNNFKNFIQHQLNPAQQDAVTTKNGSLLVIAGAGSGKTRVITSRITHLILEYDVRPEQIVALTFTNKAAKEMQQRVGHYLQGVTTLPVVATFHSYCVRLLKKYSHLLPFQEFSILDSTDQQKLLTDIIKRFNFPTKIHVKHMLYAISEYKNSTVCNTGFDFMFDQTQQFMQIYNAYEQEKKASHCLDFDDLLLYTVRLFQQNPDFKTKFQEQVRHILVDEYQDTNAVQNELLQQMALQNGALAIDSICVVGDEDQSIYSWRGATVENILNFDKLLKQTKVVKIEQNYRSTQHILDIANQVISKNINRKEKKLWSAHTSNTKTISFECQSDFQEAHMISCCIQAVSAQEKFSSIAILYRTHAQSRTLEEALLKLSIPYKIIGGIQFYERKEIKDLLAYLKLLINPYDRVSALRMLNCPPRGLGEKFEEEMLTLWQEHPHETFLQILLRMQQEKQTKLKAQSIQNIIQLYGNLDVPTTSITQAINYFCTQVAYMNYLEDSYEKAEAADKRENIYEFLRAADFFERHNSSSIAHFLEEITLFQEKIEEQDAHADCVQLMTMHGAKGLEFDTVILPGLEDGILPNNQSILEDNIEEERRLFYVGITRARKRLLLARSKTRNTYGQTNYQTPSRFLSEIPTHLLIEQPANFWSSTQYVTYFKAWAQEQNLPDKKADHVMTFAAFTPKVTKSIQPEDATGPTKEFKKLQTVKHETFGLGLVQEIEERNADKIFVTVRFYQHGIKKIDAKFLRIL